MEESLMCSVQSSGKKELKRRGQEQDMLQVSNKTNLIFPSQHQTEKSVKISMRGDKAQNVEVRRSMKLKTAGILRETVGQGQVPDLNEKRKNLKCVSRERGHKTTGKKAGDMTMVVGRREAHRTENGPMESRPDATEFFGEDETELFKQYQMKKRQIDMLHKQTDVANFELMELATKLERARTLRDQEPPKDTFDFSTIKKRASTIFNTSGHKELARKASSIIGSGVPNGKHIDNVSEYMNRFQESLQNNETTIKAFISRQTTDLDELSNKTSQLVTGLVGNLYTKSKDMQHEDDCINSSFIFDNLDINSHENEYKEYENPTREGSAEKHMIDIDEYDSDEDYSILHG